MWNLHPLLLLACFITYAIAMDNPSSTSIPEDATFQPLYPTIGAPISNTVPESPDVGNLKGPGPRMGHCSIAFNDTIYVFGGIGQPGHSNFSRLSYPRDFDVTAPRWRDLPLPANITADPQPCVVTAQNLLLVGGLARPYVYNLTSENWLPHPLQTEGIGFNVTESLGARYGSKAITVGDSVYVWGGYVVNASGPPLSPSSNTQAQNLVVGTSSRSTSSFSSVSSTASTSSTWSSFSSPNLVRRLLSQAEDKIPWTNVTNDMFILNTSTWQWRVLPQQKHTPPPINNVGIASWRSNKLFLFGGSNSTPYWVPQNYSSNIYSLDLTSLIWQQEPVRLDTPLANIEAVPFYGSNIPQFFLLPGTVDGGISNPSTAHVRVWALNSRQIEIFTASDVDKPSPRTGHSMVALQSQPELFLVYGGQIGGFNGPLSQDVYVYNMSARAWNASTHLPTTTKDVITMPTPSPADVFSHGEDSFGRMSYSVIITTVFCVVLSLGFCTAIAFIVRQRILQRRRVSQKTPSMVMPTLEPIQTVELGGKPKA
ncbi:uncharacterized protein VTP21DRAFT_5942 [Calcarisporiella thermophila]|uniref:uncharacterized protein n=1 Tax=Calcarisporiella thermophila TaxID=911321 RepID=UPI003743BA37